MTAATASCGRSWQWPVFRRTSQLHHRVRRPNSNPQQCQKTARRIYARHAYGSSTTSDGMPQEQGQQLAKGPNTSLLADELQKQWHEKLNMHLGNILIRPGSNRKVWWSCDQCPDGFPHIWEATVLNRTYGRGCPFCSGNAICQHNTLARKVPEVALFWDAKKNHPMSPDQVTVFSNMRAHWMCSACLHEWQSSVLSKAIHKTGCPKCTKAKFVRKTDSTGYTGHPTFAMAKHALLQQWDHERNRVDGNSPDKTTLRSGKLIWWQCYECPKGKVHSWQARAYSRTRKVSTGCPCCAGHQLCECNSLETVCPGIAADFDAEKNGVSAAEVTSAASTKYSWLSDEPGAKKRSVHQRTAYAKRQADTAARRS